MSEAIAMELDVEIGKCTVVLKSFTTSLTNLRCRDFTQEAVKCVTSERISCFSNFECSVLAEIGNKIDSSWNKLRFAVTVWLLTSRSLYSAVFLPLFWSFFLNDEQHHRCSENAFDFSKFDSIKKSLKHVFLSCSHWHTYLKDSLSLHSFWDIFLLTHFLSLKLKQLTK